MRKSIIKKAEKLGIRVSTSPVNRNGDNYDYKYFLEHYNTYKIIGRYNTQAELEEDLSYFLENGLKL